MTTRSAEASTANPRAFAKRWRFSLRAFLLLLTILSVAIALLTVSYTNRYRQMQRVVELLEKNEVVFKSVEPSDLPWYDQLPWLDPPPRIESIWVRRNADLETIVPELAKLGTVKQLEHYGMTIEQLEMLSQIDSIESIETSGGLITEGIRPFLSHKLKNFTVHGAGSSIPEAALELLFAIPTLESVGTANGPSDVPAALKAKRPDITICRTDFPP